MSELVYKTVDGNQAAADVAYRLNEVIAIYPITPASPMGEWADTWSAQHRPNLWGVVPQVAELQSEGGAAGAVHGALQTGSLTTTFTASQGLLLMMPNMFKIAGELSPAVIHVAARSVAAQALSIFGDHSDVMAVRSTGFAMLASSSVQETMDLAAIAQASTLRSRIPFLHFFDGFRTSHEINKIAWISDETLQALMDDSLIFAHRQRALSPEHPVLRGTAQNPDVFFQARESVNSYYLRCPQHVQKVMDQFAELTGRAYHLFEYYGHPEAERVVVIMGSGAEAVRETVGYLMAHNEKVGMVQVRLFRPFSVHAFVKALPASTRAIAVLDRTKEPGSSGEPLYLDCLAALEDGATLGWTQFTQKPVAVGGRYGLSSKEFTPGMIQGVFNHLKHTHPRNHFTVGIADDVTHTSLTYNPRLSVEGNGVVSALFFGLGSDGTVGANKNSIKIIGENTDLYTQGYFVYDSKKAGAVTVSHLRFGLNPIHSTYLIQNASFVGCHQPQFLEQRDVLRSLKPGGTFLLNTPHSPETVWDHLPRPVQEQLIHKHILFYVIDAQKVAAQTGMGRRINTIMQVCFFALSDVLPHDKAIEAIKKSIQDTYGNKGQIIVERNLKAVDYTLSHLFEVKVPEQATGDIELRSAVSSKAPAFMKYVLGPILSGEGDHLPVSALPADGTYPTGTSQWEKRNLALEIPFWDAQLCIQCGKCTMVCPHATIRSKVYESNALADAPETFCSVPARDRGWKGLRYTLQVAPEDCTGCGICVNVCPVKNKSKPKFKAINMQPQPPLREAEAANWEFFLKLPEYDRRELKVQSIHQQHVQQPLFEFSGACAGCGETPYLKLVTQLFGDRMLVANATGCSSIYGGNLPTTPWSRNAEGRGPAWSNSLFEDNAEFGLGFRLSLDQQYRMAQRLLKQLAPQLGDDLVDALLSADQQDEAGLYEQRDQVAYLKIQLSTIDSPPAHRLLEIADVLVRKSVWIVGGDGWAYDIGFGGLDHVLASGKDVNILVLDTEVYSNTGGQTSKATPLGAVAKFSAGGKPLAKKDLGLIAMSYGNVYVASVAMGAKDEHTLRTFIEAESYPGPSLILAYSHCIAHGIPMATAMQNQKAAVQTGQWLLYRFDPRRTGEDEHPLQLDSRAPRVPLAEYLKMENRFRMLAHSNPEVAQRLFNQAQEDVKKRRAHYEALAAQ